LFIEAKDDGSGGDN